MIKKAGSSSLTIAITVFYMVYFALGGGVSPHGLAGDALGALLALNILLGAFNKAARCVSRPVITPAGIEAMDASTVIENAVNPDEAIKSIFDKSGISQREINGAYYGVRGRFSFVPEAVLRLGIAMFLASILISSHVRSQEVAEMGQGDSMDVFGSQITLDEVRAPLDEQLVVTGSQGVFTLAGVGAVISSEHGKIDITTGFPKRLGSEYFRIADIGYKQGVSIGNAQMDCFLNVLPPGKSDECNLQSGGVSFTLEPFNSVKKGLFTGKVYNLKSPLLNINNEIIVGEGQSMTLNGQVASLGKGSVYVSVHAVYDPALPWAYAGSMTALAGLLLSIAKLFWRMEMLCAVASGDKVYIGYGVDAYRRWAVNKFRQWVS